MKDIIKMNSIAGDEYTAGLIANNRVDEGFKAPKFHYHVTCVDKDGKLRWEENVENVVTTVGKNDLIDKYFKGSAYTATWFLGLKGTGTPVVGDTASSHASWSEINPYSGNRPAITFGTTSAGSNTATAVAYSITAGLTVFGAFVQSVNTGTTGILYSAADFGSSRAVLSGDTLIVTLTVTIS